MGGKYASYQYELPVVRALELFVQSFDDTSSNETISYVPFKRYSGFSCESRFYIPYPNQPIYDNVKPSDYAVRTHSVSCYVNFPDGGELTAVAVISSYSSNYAQDTSAFLLTGYQGIPYRTEVANFFTPDVNYDTMKLVYTMNGNAKLIVNGVEIISIAMPAALLPATNHKFYSTVSSTIDWPFIFNRPNLVFNEPEHKIGKVIYNFF